MGGKKPRKILNGITFNSLTILEDAEDRISLKGKIKRRVRCSCICGNNSYVADYSAVVSGGTKSCGCGRGSKLHPMKYGEVNSRLYAIWQGIKARCLSPDCEAYLNYGAAGIGMEDSWKNSSSSFITYVNTLPNYGSSKSIDRVDNDKGYVIGNLRWATPSEQAENRSMYSTNSSGKCGVMWVISKAGSTSAQARWQRLEGGTGSKMFSVQKYGLLPAFKMAANYRDSMLIYLNNSGRSYTDKHGVPKFQTNYQSLEDLSYD